MSAAGRERMKDFSEKTVFNMMMIFKGHTKSDLIVFITVMIIFKCLCSKQWGLKDDESLYDAADGDSYLYLRIKIVILSRLFNQISIKTQSGVLEFYLFHAYFMKRNTINVYYKQICIRSEEKFRVKHKKEEPKEMKASEVLLQEKSLNHWMGW